MASEVEVESVRRQVDIFRQLEKSLDAQDLASYDKVDMYKQMRKQLYSSMKRYSKEGKGDLAKVISQSLLAA